MKFLFRNTDNIFMLKNKQCVYKNGHKIDILNKNDEEYSILMKIFANQEIFSDEYKRHRFLLKKLLRNNHIVNLPESISNNHKLFKSFQYLLMTGRISKYSELEKFQNRKVLIVGLGGTALEIVRQLVSLNFKNYILVDYDIVNQTNLNRQFLFQEADIGKYKIDVVENFILKNVPDPDIVKYCVKISDTEDMKKIICNNENIDIVLCCADYPPVDIELFILQSLMGRKIAYLVSGVGIYKGSIGPILTNDKARCKYIENLNKSKRVLDTLVNCSASFGITNTMVSTIMASQCIDYLLNFKPISINKILTYYFDGLEMEVQDI